MNIVIVLGSPRLTAELSKRLSNQESSLGEKIHVIPLDKSDGVAVRDESFREQLCEALIKEYFFGTVGHTLSPATQQVDFDSLTIYRLGDCECLFFVPVLWGFVMVCELRFPNREFHSLH